MKAILGSSTFDPVLPRRCESTAPGEYRLTYHHWRQVNPDGRFLGAVFNVCLLHRHTTQSWKSLRTTLMYKKGDCEDPTNWCHKGILPYDVVFENSFMLQGRLDDARTKAGELCVGFLNYADAFGSVTHQALVDAVHGVGAGETFAEILEEVYRTNTTCVVAAAGT
nr:uncharacterized protein LOC119168651 [Rhipicephalus microplus]